MKTKYVSLIAGVAVMAGMVLTGCRDENILSEGEGRMMLNASVMNDITVVSRALDAEEIAELSSKATIWISDSKKGLIHTFEGLASFPTEGLPLEVGSYVAEAWVGDSVPASWDKKRFKGTAPFEIVKGQNTQVDLSCHIRNTLVSLDIDPDVEGVLQDMKLTIGLNDGVTDGSHSLAFEGDKLTSKGYYMVNSRTDGLTWTIEGTDITNNKPVSKSGVFRDTEVADKPSLANATEYIFRVKYDTAGEIKLGGAYLTIEVDAEPIETVEQEILIAIAPDIKGIGFSLAEPVVAEPGGVGRRSLYVTGSCELKNVSISGTLLNALDAPANFYDLLNMTDNIRERLLERGVEVETLNRLQAHPDWISNVRINLDEAALNALPEGSYDFTVEATDALGQTKTMKMELEVSLAPVQAAPAPQTTSYTEVTLTAKLLDANSSNQGFEVRRVDSRAYEDWTFVAAQLNGTTLTAPISGLAAGATYEGRAVATTADGQKFEGKTFTFETKAYPQLPNAGFEDWSKDGKVDLIAAGGDKNNVFWDSGNHGSSTMSKSVTEKDTSVKHGGSCSARLRSQFVGLGSIGRFAAGNIFIGKYLKTDGTDGELGWGREWDKNARPKALRGWIKYTPGQVDQKKVYDKVPSSTPKELKAEFQPGSYDKGIIYVALVDHSEVYSDYPDFPVVIKTKTAQLFDKTAQKVKAYGEMIISEATPGNEMVEFTINLEDVNPGDFSHLMIVCSASKGGDYFLGGEGSTLWIDDFELIY